MAGRRLSRISIGAALLLFISLLAGLFLAAEEPGPDTSADRSRLKIVATTGMLADTIQQIGGDRVDVKTLMGPGVDPHVYRQTSADIAAMVRADLVIYHGLYLEAQLEAFLEALQSQKPVIALAEALPRDQLLSDDTYTTRLDPHVWMDPNLWMGVIRAARDALTKADPAGAEEYSANADRYIAELLKLSVYAERVLATVPEDERVLVTAHDAFAYFGRRFDFEVEGIQGISTESEAGLKRVEDLVTLLVTRGIRAIFVESSVSERNIRALIEGAAAKGHRMRVGGSLYSDAMGAPGTYEGTYIGMIDHNVTLIARALGGVAPAGGFAGQRALPSFPDQIDSSGR